MDEQRIPKPIILHLRAKPNTRASQLLVAPDGSVTMHLKSSPQKGQANTVLLAFLTEVFGTSKNRVELLSVYTVPFKKLALPDVDKQQLTTLLTRYRVR